jgi:hypothetical protein
MIRRRTMIATIVLALVSHVRRDRRRAAAEPRAVSRLQDRRRQQGGALGPDRRLHEALPRRIPTACGSASSERTSDNNPFIALEISAPDTLKNLVALASLGAPPWKYSLRSSCL